FDNNDIVILVIRLCLTVFLLPSAIGKMMNMRAFVQGVAAYDILRGMFARLFGYILPWIELCLAGLLLAGIALPQAGLASGGLILIFIGAITLNIRQHRAIACNCYGIAGSKLISWGSVVRNILLLLLCGLLVYLAPKD